MKVYNFVLSILFLIIVQNVYSQQYVDSLIHDDITRYYRLYIPPTFAEQSNLPLVFNLHGLGSNAFQQQFYSKMNEVADTAGFIICYPEGINNSWNSGFQPNGTDDVGFIDVLIDQLLEVYNIDLNRVYSCGMSNGGYQSYYLACELPSRFAAIASVTGTMFPSVYNSCDPNRSMPILQIHGTNDDTVLYNGSAAATPIEQVIKFWVENNLCTAEGDTIAIADVDTTDNSTAQLISYTNCDDNSAVHFYKIFNGEHTWPDAAVDLLGVTNHDFNASEAIWNFFEEYSLENQVLDVPSITDLSINIQPNPANNFITIKGITKASYINIYNTDGRLIEAFGLVNSNTVINIANLKPGLYLVNVFEKGKVKVGKLIVQ